jgi:hypothetical protein
MNSPDFLEAEETLTDFLESFEQGTWPKSGWTHAAHVAVAACYLIECAYQDAADLMRRGIVHYNQCVGTINSDHSGYHETLTLFWLAIVKARLGELADGLTRAWRPCECWLPNWPHSATCSVSTTASMCCVP